MKKLLILMSTCLFLFACTSSNNSTSNLDNALNSVVIVETPTGTGSGVIINSESLISTNAHVVFIKDKEGNVIGNLQKVNIKFYDGTSIEGDIVYFNKEKDIAIIKIKKQITNFSAPQCDYQITIAEEVYAIGHPLGMDWTVTKGIISYIKRNFAGVKNMIQIDAAIFLGNSGGGLFNKEWKLIGIPQSISIYKTTITGHAFAIPITELCDILKERNF